MATDRRVTFLIGANVKQFKKGLQSAQRRMQRFGREMERAGQGFTQSVTAPLGLAAGAAAKAAIDFESAFAGVRKTVNATEEEFATLEQGIRSMSKEMPTSANEIAAVAESAGQLGIKTDAILGFSETMVKLGDTTNMTAQEAATSMARIANVMQIPQDQFDEMGSTIVDLGNNFATTEKEITDMATRIAGAGKVAGLANSDIFAISTSLSSVGIQAESGGTAVQKALLGINDAVVNGGEVLDTYAQTAGMTSEAFQRAWRQDAGQAFTSFVNGLGQAGDSATTILSDVGLKSERTRAAFLSLAGAGDTLTKAIDAGRTAWERNTALTAEAQQRYKTMQSQLSILYNRLYDLGITIGNQLIPQIQKMIPLAESAIDYIQGMSKESINLSISIAKWAAALGPGLMLIGKLVKTFSTSLSIVKGFGTTIAWVGKQAIGIALTGSVTKAHTAMRLMRMKGLAPLVTALSSNPWTVFIAGAIAAAGYIYKVQSRINDLNDTIDSAMTGNADSINEYNKAIQGMSDRMAGIIEQANAVGVEVDLSKEAAQYQDLIEARSKYIEMLGNKARDSVSVNRPDPQVLAPDDLSGQMNIDLNLGTKAFSSNIEKAKASAQGFGSTLVKAIPVEKLKKATGAATGSIAEIATKTRGVGEALANEITPMIAGAMANMAASFVGGIAQAAVAGGGMAQVFQGILTTLADLAIRVGKIAIGVAVAVKGIKEALKSLNPVVAFAAGAALIAIGSLAKSALAKAADKGSDGGGQQRQGMATGGIVPPGYKNDTYPANLSSGEAVLTPQDQSTLMDKVAMAGGGGGQQTMIHNVVKIGERVIYEAWENAKESYR